MTEQVLDNYAELLDYMNEVRDGLGLLHEWLTPIPKIDDYYSYHNLIVQHAQYFAVLQLCLRRLDDLNEEHQAIIDKFTKERV